MTPVPGADIRGYYTALGIQFPAWVNTQAHLRCFVNPDVHSHNDRHPSMSISLQHGAFYCHACGAKGGAFDAAIMLGYDARSAIELMIDHGLTDRRSRMPQRHPRDGSDAPDPWLTPAEIAAELRLVPATIRSWIDKGDLQATRAGKRKWLVRRSELDQLLQRNNGAILEPQPAAKAAARSLRRAHATSILAPTRPRPSRRLTVSEADVQRWHLQLLAQDHLIARLAASRGWCPLTIRRLQLGLDRGCITIPVRNQHGRLISLLRYCQGHGAAEPKLRAAPGSRRALFPHPDAEASRELLLVEGEPDAIAARSRGLPAVAIPGVNAWRPAWAPSFSDRTVTIIFDTDAQGRACASAVAPQVAAHAAHVAVLDLAPDRDDGYDLTDWLLEHRGDGARISQQLHRLTQPAVA